MTSGGPLSLHHHRFNPAVLDDDGILWTYLCPEAETNANDTAVYSSQGVGTSTAGKRRKLSSTKNSKCDVKLWTEYEALALCHVVFTCRQRTPPTESETQSQTDRVRSSVCPMLTAMDLQSLHIPKHLAECFLPEHRLAEVIARVNTDNFRRRYRDFIQYKGKRKSGLESNAQCVGIGTSDRLVWGSVHLNSESCQVPVLNTMPDCTQLSEEAVYWDGRPVTNETKTVIARPQCRKASTGLLSGRKHCSNSVSCQPVDRSITIATSRVKEPVYHDDRPVPSSGQLPTHVSRLANTKGNHLKMLRRRSSRLKTRNQSNIDDDLLAGTNITAKHPIGNIEPIPLESGLHITTVRKESRIRKRKQNPKTTADVLPVCRVGPEGYLRVGIGAEASQSDSFDLRMGNAKKKSFKTFRRKFLDKCLDFQGVSLNRRPNIQVKRCRVKDPSHKVQYGLDTYLSRQKIQERRMNALDACLIAQKEAS